MTKQTPKIKKAATEPKGSRKLKPQAYRSFRLQKRVKHVEGPKPMGGFRLFAATLRTIRENWKTFLGISLIYAILNQILVQGILGFDVASAKEALTGVWRGGIAAWGNGFSVLTSLFGSKGEVSDVAGLYQFILMIIGSLAIIWTFRHVKKGQKVRVRDGFYKGMYPLIPFLFVYLVMALQVTPVALGTYLYNASGPGFAIVNGVEAVIWVLVMLLLTILTLYLLSSSVFALYISSLPGATPLESLRTARKLVYGRRLVIIRRFVVLPILVLIVGGALLIPAILLSSVAAVITYFILNMLLLPVVHGYMYGLYQELLREAK